MTAKHRHASVPTTERPGNRPFGIPANARWAGVPIPGFLAIAIAALDAWTVWRNASPATYFHYGKIMFFPLIAAGVLMAWALNSGKLVMIRLWRVFARLVVVAYALLAVIFIAELAVYPVSRAFGAVIGLIILLLTAPFFLLMRRDFRRSRWLDPDSLPSEWEIAAIHDPNSINYQPPKRKRR
ncbi:MULTISPECIES: hypothetical protein [unclassified Acidiphilium]|uniref:hypothetical protein n=1 Tax=unclassified Acidiphilium TaxID=2617493 RepID=UPI000BCA5A19|nr:MULTISPECIES: hypothetical protein [unclassified Acidiphilium]OYV57692.1 MAG: hypothetical protein B7Z76_00530 [Acidiphilium sp. 20-67-58]HQT59990.1 hypothetical protein [Acidiphilium sp.]